MPQEEGRREREEQFNERGRGYGSIFTREWSIIIVRTGLFAEQTRGGRAKNKRRRGIIIPADILCAGVGGDGLIERFIFVI